MAYYSLLFTYLLAFFSLISTFCHSFNPKLLNVSKVYQSSSDWLTTGATWYGEAHGAGSTGGACGYQTAVASAPFSSFITAVAPSLYKSGKGCGACYQVKCSSSKYCSGKAVTVVATDSCPGCDHLFDLSGTSIGGMAIPGQENQLRNVGTLQIQYKSVHCDYPGVNIAFRVDSGSNANYFATAIEYQEGDGLTGAWIRQANAKTDGAWIPMQLSWGAVWMANLPNNYLAPYSIKLTNSNSGTVVANSVIPANYVGDRTYRSLVNFNG